ncbi:MAG: SLC13 family permease [Bacteroidetes bacterium]|nr:SLC13 family permease [Bacteroidota bacterium]
MNKRTLILSAGPILFFIIASLAPLSYEQSFVLASLAWMLAWWLSNRIPLGVTALLPLILFPLAGILSPKEVGALYGHLIIFLFLGGFALGLAIEKWNLHRRIALHILLRSGTSPNRILLGTMLATAALSMWISNTATTIMMLPIGLSLFQLLEEKMGNAKASKNFGIALMLGIAYSANIGGMATLIGTPPNLVFASLSSASLGREVAFSDWLLFAFPLSAVLFILVWFVLSKVLFPSKETSLQGIEPLLRGELKKLGKPSSAERKVAIVLGAMAIAWVFRAQLNQIQFLEHLSDTLIAIAGLIVLFILPSGSKGKALLNEQDLGRLPWNIILLFGGGLSLAKALEISKLVQTVAETLVSTGWSSLLIISLLICAFAVFLTEVMSNVALVSVFVPVAFIIASELGFDPWYLAIPLSLGASCAFMFPVATPPNAIVYSSGYIRTADMAKAGIIFNVISIVLISLYSYFMIPLIFKS